MQSLDVISVNIWDILISFINLIILFFIIKKFLFKPISSVLEKRASEIDESYAASRLAEDNAKSAERAWKEKFACAADDADNIISNASECAKLRAEKIIAEANERADGIVRAAKSEAELEEKKAADIIRREIVEVSGELAEKLLEREIAQEDHRALIDSFIEKIGDEHE